jgi:hypothetical protein
MTCTNPACDGSPGVSASTDVLLRKTGSPARQLMAQDPSIRAGVQSADLYPFTTFLAREHGPQG